MRKIKEKIKKFYDDYEYKNNIFENYGKTVANIMESLLNKNSFQYHIISHRVKSFESIENKMLDGSIKEEIKELTDIDDIIGCRVIFYLESDIQRFENLLYEEFLITKHNLKYSEADYNALHLVVELNSSRLKLMEYEDFSSLKCEIQLTTVLFHSWSEISHNIIYKMPKGLSEFDELSVLALKKQFKEVMKNHIKPASYTFEFINERFTNLLKGKKIFDLIFLQSIINSNSRNEIYEKMSLLRQFIIEFGDKTPNDFNLFVFIPNVIEKSKNLNDIGKNENNLSSLYGFEHYHVVEVCLDILNEIRYFNIEETLKILIGLADHEENMYIKDKTNKIISNLSKYNLKVIEKTGYLPQLKILFEIDRLSFEMKTNLWESIEKIFRNLLDLEFHDYSITDYNKISLLSGVIGFNEQLKEIRNCAINILIEIYLESDDKFIRINILKTLMEATKLPRMDYDYKIEEIVLDNVNQLVNWFIIQNGGFNLKEIKILENNVQRLLKEYPNKDILLTLEILIIDNSEYCFFKTLVGYNKRDTMEQRKIKTAEFIEEITLEDYSKWEKRILSVADDYSREEQGEFFYFNTFLFRIGKLKPDFAKGLLHENKVRLEVFLASIVAGIMSSTSKNNTYGKHLISEWINENKYVEQCANVYMLKEIDFGIINKIFEGARNNENIAALNNLLQVIMINKELYQQLSYLFIEIIIELSNHNDFYWTHQIWFDDNSILHVLNESDFDMILGCLLKSNSIEFHMEELLKPICIENPEKIINFFENRVSFKIQKQSTGYNRFNDRYDVIPHNFYEMHKLLKDKSEIIIPLLIDWFNKPELLFQREASHLIKNIFSEFDEPLQDFLNGMIFNGDEEDANRVLQIIREYEGSSNTYDVCKNLIKKYEKNKKLMQGIMSALIQIRGGVSGEYGFVKAYEERKREIRRWQNSNNKEIKKFVRDFIIYINQIIIQEKRRSDNRIEMMRRRYEEI